MRPLDATPGADLLSMIEEFGGFNETGGLPEPSLDDSGELPVEGDVPVSGEEVFRIYGATGSPYLRDGVGDYYNGSWYMHGSLSVPYWGQYVASVVGNYSGYQEHHYYVEPAQALGGFIPSPLHPLQVVVDWNMTFYPEHGLFRVDDPLTLSYGVQSDLYVQRDDAREGGSLQHHAVFTGARNFEGPDNSFCGAGHPTG